MTLDVTPFQRHGKAWLSIEEINCYARNPSEWARSYLLGLTREGVLAPRMVRGQVVHSAVGKGLANHEATEAAIKHAQGQFVAVVGPGYKVEMQIIAPCVRRTLLEVSKIEDELGNYLASNLNLTWSNELPIPVIGCADLVFENCVVELKTRHPFRKRLRNSTVRQIAIYAEALAKQGIIAIISPYGATRIIRIQEPARVATIENTKSIILRMERDLGRSDDPRIVAQQLGVLL